MPGIAQCLSASCPLTLSSLLAEPDRGFPGAIPSAAPEQRESPAPACVHVPSPGVSHQHRLLQPVDGPALAPAPPSWSNVYSDLGMAVPLVTLGKNRSLGHLCVGSAGSPASGTRGYCPEEPGDVHLIAGWLGWPSCAVFSAFDTEWS